MANGHRNDVNEKPQKHQFNDDWIKNGIKEDAIAYADELGKRLAEEEFSNSQIRNFYGELKRIQLNIIGSLNVKQKSAFHLLHPKLAYAAKRAKKRGATTFKDEILKAHAAVKIDQDDSEERFEHFCDLCEAILAFHKAYGGQY